MFDEFLHKNLKIPYLLHFEKLRENPQAKATVIFIHGIASASGMWSEAEKEIEGEFDLYAVDLLGHGLSKKPHWRSALTIETQARALRRSILRMKTFGRPVFLVGHSMGSLVAAEFAKKYPYIVEEIFLLSPPIYSPEEAKGDIQEWFLKKNYKEIVENPEDSIKFVNRVIDAKLVDVKRFDSQEEFRPIRKALREAIIEQNTFETLSKVKTPTKIIYGIFDPVVIGRNIRKLAKENSNITVTRVLASHDPTKEMMQKISKEIDKILKEKYE